MTIALTIQDATTATFSRPAVTLTLICPDAPITVRELIRLRVYQEVQAYHEQKSDFFHGLVQPSEAEQTLNGYRLKLPRRIDWEEQFQRAVEAFEHNGFVLLVDRRQVESLEETLTLTPETQVTFLKLIPLVGG